ncbi:multiheme c-type cytochrome [Niabella aquatica]
MKFDSIKNNWKLYNGAYKFPDGDWVESRYSNDGVYQVAHIKKDNIKQKADIYFGFGRHAQSFAHWSESILVQLPLTYFNSRDKWYNSPGYPNKIFLNRVITSRCLECHTSYAEITAQEGMVEKFNPNTIVYGIDCEKCHGPGADHIAWANSNNKETSDRHIMNLRSFSRQQSIDMCALCHSGVMSSLKPAFSFKPGDKLSEFYAYNLVATSVESLDVHGNQYGLLSMSKCFEKSELTCLSCHDPHKNESQKRRTFSQRCMSCHSENERFCKFKKQNRETLINNCIDCHMPEKHSESIVFLEENTGKKITAKLRTHLIKIYPDNAKEVIAFIKNQTL